MNNNTFWSGHVVWKLGCMHFSSSGRRVFQACKHECFASSLTLPLPPKHILSWRTHLIEWIVVFTPYFTPNKSLGRIITLIKWLLQLNGYSSCLTTQVLLRASLSPTEGDKIDLVSQASSQFLLELSLWFSKYYDNFETISRI